MKEKLQRHAVGRQVALLPLKLQSTNLNHSIDIDITIDIDIEFPTEFIIYFLPFIESPENPEIKWYFWQNFSD